jgi:hypothetical protein
MIEYDPFYFSDKYRSSLGWRLGAEYTLPVTGTVLRAGYMRQPLTFKGPRVTAMVNRLSESIMSAIT